MKDEERVRRGTTQGESDERQSCQTSQSSEVIERAETFSQRTNGWNGGNDYRFGKERKERK